jgi:hypothetical protein
MNGYMLKTIGVIKEMAAKGGVSLEKAINMIEVYEAQRHDEQSARRSTDDEKNLVRSEVAKLDETILRDYPSKDIAKVLIDKGVAIRSGVQGVLSVISRTRRELLTKAAA